MQAAIEGTVQRCGRLDLALNVAGVGGPYGGFHNMPNAVWQRSIDIHLTGVFYCVKHELQQFLKQGGGVIANMSSLAGLKAEQGLVPCTAATHGVLWLTKNIAAQYGEQHIRAHAICPCCIETPLIRQAPDDLRLGWIAGRSTRRLGQPDEVAKAFNCLASDDASQCNGTQLILNGGMTC